MNISLPDSVQRNFREKYQDKVTFKVINVIK